MSNDTPKPQLPIYPKAPSRSLISRIQERIDKSLPHLDERDLLKINLYKFIEKQIACFDEIRFQAEEYAKKNSDKFIVRLNKEMPLEWSKVVKSFIPRSDEPPMQLIVQIALNFNQELMRLANSPRKVLRQLRQKEHLSRIQKIDSNCMVWLSRQPGRNTIEKAGSRQKILAVVRKETYDILENRVLKHMLSLCHKAATSYYSSHKNEEKYKASKRLQSVKNLMNETKKLLRSEVFESIAGITKTPKPNYVLMYDANYKAMWDWYIRLVRQQEEAEASWKYQGVLFQDWCRLAVTASLMKKSEFKSPLFTHNLWIRSKPDEGRWLFLHDWPGPFLLKNGLDACILKTSCLKKSGDADKPKPFFRIVANRLPNRKACEIFFFSLHYPMCQDKLKGLLSLFKDSATIKNVETHIIFFWTIVDEAGLDYNCNEKNVTVINLDIRTHLNNIQIEDATVTVLFELDQVLERIFNGL